ncbi:nickel-dependent hydrogenase large subunit [Sulfurimonas sp. SAG-AH-194-C20]|nr:nickel-dependent hydrogenase large subunit [Sulfurimonas sp. SAG-AH-194-C20]MDF1878947.1 nickel-dependent hydrogenase large subunit [Sulfurimonas sp. SAG-AH-194-C20]
MSNKIIELEIPVNRVEGDLDIKIKIKDNKIIDAKSVGTLYRGFENILKGRVPLDSLVITPRVCGICSVAHLLAAAKALDNAYKIIPPPQAVRIRNLSILAESVQSDLRQHYLMYMSDFASDYYKDKEFSAVAKEYYEPFKGTFAIKTLDITKDILKVIALLGGQWPHTSHIVPGGVISQVYAQELLEIHNYISKTQIHLVKEIYTQTLEELCKINSFEALEKNITKYPDSQLAIFTNIAKETNLFHTGKTGYGFISYGCVDNPNEHGKSFIPAGYSDGKTLYPFDESKITEDATYAWFKFDRPLHPFDGLTEVQVKKEKAYTWAKAVRYDAKTVQTGPLAEFLMLEDPLFLDLIEKFGDSTYVRQLARFLRPSRLIGYMLKMTDEALEHIQDPVYIKPTEIVDTQGYGLTTAARGALGHWIKIKDSKIDSYQIISPTTWNGSPKDGNEQAGPWEKALIGLEIQDYDNPIEMGHIIRSFDPCLVCTVHSIDNDKISYKIGYRG